MVSTKKIITIAIIFSVFLYLAGVFSGLYASKSIEASTSESLLTLKEDTDKELEQLESAITQLDDSLQNTQLEQLFIESLDQEQQCAFSQLALDQRFSELRAYWDALPFRLEDYSPENPTEYAQVQERYSLLVVRTLVLAKTVQSHCDESTIITGVNFYTAGCTDCVTQGEELDQLKHSAALNNSELVIFSIDLNVKHSIVEHLRNHYRISETPAVLLDTHVFQGRVFSTEELEGVLKTTLS